MRARQELRPRLTDRRAECARLDRLIAAARSGSSGALVVRGEPGVGKTAILEYLVFHAPGCRIARASGVESEMELAFAGLQQLCVSLIDQVGSLPAPQHDALKTAFGLRGGDPPDRFMVGLAVLSLLSDAAAEQPVVCLVDDAQWLDRSSAQVLGFVARRLASESVVIVFAARDSAQVPDLADLSELRIPPLADADARAVLASATPIKIDRSVRDRIVAEARGNPLALLELPKAWTAEAIAGGFGLPDGLSVPTRVEESFRRRLTQLPDRTKQLLLVAAAEPVGDPMLVWAAAKRLGIPADAASPAVSSGLLNIGAQFLFRHPLVRSVVYRDASIDDRRLAHAALAEATDASLDPDRRAWHLAAAATGPSEDVAVELEASAGRAQARGGVGAAAAFLQRAVALTVDSARRGQRALAAAQVSLQAGEFDTALALVNAAEAGPLDAFQSAQLDLLRGHVAFASGDPGQGSRSLLQAAQQLERFDVGVARETYLLAWGAAFVASQHLAGRDLLFEICGAVQGLPPRPGGSAPIDFLLEGLALLTTEGRAAAAAPLQRAAKALTDISVNEVLRWGWVAQSASVLAWDHESYLTICRRQARLVRDVGALAQLPLLLANAAIANLWVGDLEGAESIVAETESVVAATRGQFAPYALLWLRALQGRESDAAAVIASAIQQTAPGAEAMATHAHHAAAILYNGLAKYDQATASARTAAANTADPFYSMWALYELVEAATHSGATALAVDAFERLEQTTRPFDSDFARGIESRSRAMLSEGNVADELYRAAVDHFGRTPLGPELARTHLLYGEWLRREGRRRDARSELRAAYDIFVTTGMEGFAGRARRELVATGDRVRKRTVETLDQVTPQEMQIARLAGEGQTSREIGAQLFLSPRTVEWHLGHVFSKLGIASRKELRSALPPVPRLASQG